MKQKNKLQSQVGEKKVIVLITGDIFSAVLHRICCDALDSTQVSSHAIYISNYFIPKDVNNRFKLLHKCYYIKLHSMLLHKTQIIQVSKIQVDNNNLKL